MGERARIDDAEVRIRAVLDEAVSAAQELPCENRRLRLIETAPEGFECDGEGHENTSTDRRVWPVISLSYKRLGFVGDAKRRHGTITNPA